MATEEIGMAIEDIAKDIRLQNVCGFASTECHEGRMEPLTPSNKAHVDRYHKFSRPVNRVEMGARTAAVLYGLNDVLVAYMVTWATGALIPSMLNSKDFYGIFGFFCILTLRFYTNNFIGISVNRMHYLCLDCHDQTLQPNKDHDSLRAKLFFAIAKNYRVILLFMKLPLACIYVVPSIQFAHARVKYDLKVWILYCLILLHGVVSLFITVHDTFIIPLYAQSHTLRNYYEQLLCGHMTNCWIGQQGGIITSEQKIDVLAFIFPSLAQLLGQLEEGALTFRLHEDLAEYVYFFPEYKGCEAARKALLSGDVHMREAAARMVHLWAEKGILEKSIRRQRNLLSALAQVLQDNILGAGRVAALCFERLGKNEEARKFMLSVKSWRSGEKLVHILIDLVWLSVFEREEENESLEFARALIALMPLVTTGRMKSGDMGGCSEEKLGRLRQALNEILTKWGLGKLEKKTLASAACADGIADEMRFLEIEMEEVLRQEDEGLSSPEERECTISVLGFPDSASGVEWFNTIVAPPTASQPDVPRDNLRIISSAICWTLVSDILPLAAWGVLFCAAP